jgi:hypothetical protein
MSTDSPTNITTLAAMSEDADGGEVVKADAATLNPIRNDGTARIWSEHPDSLKHYGQEWQSDDARPMHAVLTIEAPDQMYLGLYFEGFEDEESGDRCHLWEFDSVGSLTAALQAIGIAEHPWLFDRLLTVNEEGETVWNTVNIRTLGY